MSNRVSTKTDRTARTPRSMLQRIDYCEEAFKGEGDKTVGGRHEHAPQWHLCKP